MSEETNLIQPSPAVAAASARVKMLQEERSKLERSIIGGFSRQHPGSHERNWSQDFSHENGMYENICIHCKLHFLGHKRRMVCFKCAPPPPEQPNGQV
jgi:hypothetical protein